ncbi:methyltransferase [Nocardia sp. CDC153]|uniref:methyltransferase n=1 Tax=Nocardia sp. CDC153 TaxID=3112167 RepID=UPI002DBE26D4|nr:methyltransferase [Nocardia sp. CDC153]MEC3952033.1 methyltransferase [Nocardia sp. CDC153]
MTTFAAGVDTPAGILRLGKSFCEAKVLLTAVELDLFSVLHDSPATPDTLRGRLGLHGRGLADVLALLTEIGLLEHDNGAYRNSETAERHLVRGGRSYLGDFLLRFNRNLYPAYGNLTDALRTGAKQRPGDFTVMLGDPDRLRKFVLLMDSLTSDLGPALVEAFDWGHHQAVLDVGGCRGNLLSHILSEHPDLTGGVFDLPPMRPLFEELMAERGLADRSTFHAGDFFEQELPSADVIMLGHVLHDWDEREREAIVGKAFRALEPGGALLVYDRMLEAGPSLAENLVISLDMMMVTDGGSEYPAEEIHRYARAAGATSTQRRLGEHDTLVICRTV